MLKIKNIENVDIKNLFDAFNEVGWLKPIEIFQKYFEEQENNERIIYVAYVEDEIAGYGTLIYKSSYPYFAERNIPEIMDLNILSKFRNFGIATKILDILEKEASEFSETVGIGVGLYKDYGSAQSIYIKRGYLPNKGGITYEYKNVVPGESYRVDDDLVLWFIKKF